MQKYISFLYLSILILHIYYSQKSIIKSKMSEKFALKWNDFQTNWNKSLIEWRKETDFADVTLISEDKVKFSAHRILLSSCSTMFKFILKDNTQVNPLLYLGGVSSKNIGFILDYIYNGEVNLYQEHLDGFLESAEKLEIAGIIGTSQDLQKKEKGEIEGLLGNDDVDSNISLETNHVIDIEEYNEAESVNEIEGRQLMNKYESKRKVKPWLPSNDIAKFDIGSLNPEGVQHKIKELYKKVDGVWECLACDYTTLYSSCNIIRHIQRNHFKKL